MSHRRQRHLNPVACGAVQVYDARFLTGLANNDPVGTFAGRNGSGYDITSSGGARPTFKAGALNGQNCLSFDGGDYLVSSSGGALLNWLTAYSVFVVAKPTSLVSAPVLWAYGAGVATQFGELGTGASVRHYWGSAATFRSYGTANPAVSTSAAAVFSYRKTAASAGDLAMGGSVQASYTGTLGSNGTTAGAFILGAYTTSPTTTLTGDIALYVAVPSTISASLHKRLEHAAARSFKLACN